MDSIIERVREILTLGGFETSEPVDVRSRSFDFAARRDTLLLLLKCLMNIDSLSEETAHELKYLAHRMFASPLVVGERTRNYPLTSSVVYMRYGVPVVNTQTLHECFVEGIPPLVRAEPGGFYVSIDGESLRALRIDRGLSLGVLARMLGVSRRTVKKYEDEGMKISLELAMRLEDIFDVPLIKPVNITKMEETSPEPPSDIQLNEFTARILSLLEGMGFDVFPTKHAPFSALSQDSKEFVTVLTAIARYNRTMVKRAKLLGSISEVANTESVVVIEGRARKSSVGNTALVTKDELYKIDESEKFIELIHERKKAN
ncbi:transcriptional regulator [Methanosarcinales archaeon]|nr:MAG: transcriptional regulator [Methanosarcinales archaeon]